MGEGKIAVWIGAISAPCISGLWEKGLHVVYLFRPTDTLLSPLKSQAEWVSEFIKTKMLLCMPHNFFLIFASTFIPTGFYHFLLHSQVKVQRDFIFSPEGF